MNVNDEPHIPEQPAKPIALDAYGDPVRQGSLMNERQSYERVIEGLKIASDAAMHLLQHEPESALQWGMMGTRLDQARRICVQYAGLGLAMKEKQTEQRLRGKAMSWRQARDRFREGLVQSAGGCRQLATCHRSDLWFSRMATDLEELARKIRTNSLRLLPGLGASRIILPN